MHLQNYLHLIVVVLVVLGPVFQWIFKTLKEQAAAKRDRDQRERREAESLRTGRSTTVEPTFPEPSPAQAAQTRLQEIADRRRRQLDELKARKAAARGEPTPTPTLTPAPTPVSMPVPTVDASMADSKRQEAARRLERQRQEQARRRDTARRQAEQQADFRRVEEQQQRQQQARAEAVRRQAAEVADRTAVAQPSNTAAKVAATGALIGKLNSRSLRHAIILQEVLGPPVSSRDPRSTGGLG